MVVIHTLFVAKASLDQTIASTSSTTNAPSTLAVYNSLSSLGSGYVKLNSSDTQIITSNIIISSLSQGYCQIDNLYIRDQFIGTSQFIDSNASRFGLGSYNEYTELCNVTSGTVNASLKFYRDVYQQYSKHVTLEIDGDLKIKIESNNNISGNAVANYSAITPTPPASVTDGRLTTVDYVKSLIPSTINFAQLDASNTFTGTTNTFAGVSATSYTGIGVYDTYSSSTWDTATDEIPTVSSVKSAISDASTDILTHASDVNAVGSIGLFIYTEIDSSTGIGAQKLYGEFVNGAYLKPAGISLPTSGQISYKSVQASTTLSGKWKLLSVAMKRTATEPCLVMAQKVDTVFS